MKNSIEARPPGSNCGFVPLRVENTRDKISFVWFDGTPLDLRHGPAIDGVVSISGAVGISTGFNSRCQLVNRLEYGPTQLIRLSVAQSPVKGSTDIGTVQS